MLRVSRYSTNATGYTFVEWCEMVGRQAEKALAALEAGDVPLGLVPTLDRATVSYENGLVLRRVRMAKRVTLDRDEVMAMMRPGITILDPRIREVNGADLWTFNVGIRGTVLTWYEGEVHVHEQGRSVDVLCTTRVKRDNRATIQWSEAWTPHHDQSFKKIKVVNPRSSELRWQLANMYAMCAARWHASAVLNDVPRELVAIREALPHWLMEEGLPAKWLEEIRSASKVVDVMGA